jgi:acyl carrier protein
MEARIGMQDACFERLAGCFEKVFPKLSRNEIPNATEASVAGWDSMAHVTLLSLIGEEFGVDIDFEDFEGATSFPAILELVRARAANA